VFKTFKMKKNLLFLCLCLILCVTLLNSCKKDNSASSNNNITGNWKFVSVTAHTQVDNQYADGGILYKTTSISDYTSTQNEGTVNISGDSMNGDGIAYSINTEVKAYNYADGMLLDSLESPFSFSVPSASLSATYKMIGNDSLYFPGQSLFGAPGTAAATGAKYTISGNTFTMQTHIVKDSTSQFAGVTMQVHEVADVKTVLQKQ
jgi:hypothetical protein